MSNLDHAIKNAHFSTKKGIDNRVVSLIITNWRLFLPSSAVVSNSTFLCRFGRRRCPPGTQPLNRHNYFLNIEALIMIRISLLLLTLTAAVLFTACGSTPSNNANGNSNRAVTLDNNNLPPGLSTSPVPITGTPTPGIPASPMSVPKGATPTPGIPSEVELKKPMKPGVTPTPGIPSEEEIRRQMGMQPKAGTPPPGASTDTPMMKKNTNKLPKKPQ